MSQPVRSKPYLDFIRAQPCILCAPGEQESRTEAAHTGVRGLGQKASDTEAIPLCGEHHRLGPESHHVLGKRFFTHHGLDRESLVNFLQQTFYVEVSA